MIALGIDPGTERVGYGLIKKEGSRLSLIEAGLLTVTHKDPAQVMREIKEAMDTLILRTKPDVAGIEKLFFSNNQKTALGVSQARGVILLSLAEHGMRIKEYTPNEIKLGISGYGAADKKTVLKMVRLFLKEPTLSLIDDASDALAIAIMASQQDFPN